MVIYLTGSMKEKENNNICNEQMLLQQSQFSTGKKQIQLQLSRNDYDNCQRST